MSAKDILDEPGWRRLLDKARRSLERTGGEVGGAVSLDAPTDAERLVIIGVTGTHRSAGASRLKVRLGELDEHLRVAHGTSLAEVLGDSVPLRNLPPDTSGETVAQDALMTLAADGRHATAGWYAEWLDTLRRDGTLTRIVRTGFPFPDVIRVLDALPAADEPLPVFAGQVLYNTKGLTDGPLRGLVLRALAIWQGVPVPVDSEQERALLESVGLVPDDLASQVLVLNVPAAGGLLGSWLTQAGQAGVPLRVTLHQLRMMPLRLSCDEIFVCGNSAVLRAAATVLGADSRALICTEGVPAAAVHALLRGASGAVIRWRNDFDWTGVRLTGSALNRYPNAVPWRMAAVDYRPAAGAGTALVGAAMDTPWDPALCGAMRGAGVAVTEERLLMELLADLG